MKGKISQWNDDKGFGFITVKEKKGRVFFHISSIKTRSRRPEVGDNVEFDLGKDKNGKVRATSVAIEGLSKSPTNKSGYIKVEPPKKNILDFLLIAIAIASVGYSSYSFYLIQNLEIVWPYLVPGAIAFFLLGRSKKPKQEHFSCAKCKAVERFNPRTISAWNRGMTRLFCSKCHSDWVKNNPRQQANYRSGSSGCLGMLLVLSALPIIGGVTIYQWLA